MWGVCDWMKGVWVCCVAGVGWPGGIDVEDIGLCCELVRCVAVCCDGWWVAVADGGLGCPGGMDEVCDRGRGGGEGRTAVDVVLVGAW